MRLTGGRLRGREIRAPKGAATTRPTLSRLREALFNSLQGKLDDAEVLDLFAGSGALGLEALSRGARRAVFVDRDGAARKVIAGNLRSLGLGEQGKILRDPVDRAARRLAAEGPFDVAFADPPYESPWAAKLLDPAFPWGEILRDGGLFCMEFAARDVKDGFPPERSGVLVKIRQKNYGDTGLVTYRAAHS